MLHFQNVQLPQQGIGIGKHLATFRQTSVREQTAPLPVRPFQLPWTTAAQISEFKAYRGEDHTSNAPVGQRPNPTPGRFEVTLLHLCDPRVAVCHGCGQPLKSAGIPMPPPADLVFVGKMRRDYVMGGEKRQGKLGNVYFHASSNCIRQKQAHYMPSLLFVDFHVRQLLTPLHKQFLLNSLHFSA